MNIAIITFPLINNYGGIIQAFALSKLLEDLGHRTTLINLQQEKKAIAISKYIFKKYALFFIPKFKNATLTIRNPELIKFIDDNFTNKTKELYNSKMLHHFFDKNEYDACVVGSDQVFSTMGYPNFENDYSLGFVPDDTIKLSYAASFGGGDYQGDQSKISFHSQNLKRFSGVSVRESSGIDVCRDRFGVEAIHVLDPTMMISKEYYLNLIMSEPINVDSNKLFAYVLDSNADKNEIISEIAEQNQLDIYQINDGNGSTEVISMNKWLASIYNAEHVITDSFHGCVFCIIFNKPFHCFVNEQRGADRFYSLLKMFGLENRIIKGDINQATIDWEFVNNQLEFNRKVSSNFIAEILI